MIQKFIDQKIVAAGFSLAVLTLVSVSGVTYYSFNKLIKLSDSRTDTQTELTALKDILATITDAETARRGYIITNLEWHLDPYKRALITLDPKLKELDRLLSKHPEQQHYFKQLQKLIRQRLELLQKSTVLQQKTPKFDDVEIKYTNQGKLIHDQIRAIITQLEQQANQKFQQEQHQVVNQANKTLGFILGGFTLSIGLFGLVYYILIQQIKYRKNADFKFKDLYENAPCGYHSLNKNAVFIEMNNTELSWLGYSRDEIIGKIKFSDIITPESLTTFQTKFPQFIEQGWIQNVEIEMVRKDGTILPVSLNATAIKDAKGNFVATRTTIFDITQRKQAEAALRASEKRLKTIIEAEPECVKILNLDGTLVDMNAAGLKMIEAENLQQVKGHSVCSLIVPEHQELFNQLTQQAAIGNSGTLEFELIGLQGTKRWLESHAVPLRDEQNQIINVLGITRDITEKKLALEAMRESEERFRRAIVDAPIPIMLHAEDGEVIQINRAWEEITGYTQSLIPTIADWTEKAYGEKKELVREDIEKLYNLDQRVAEGEYTLVTRNGETRIWDFYSAPLGKLVDGRHLIISTAIDITARKRVELALQQAKNDLEIKVDQRTTELSQTNRQLEVQLVQRELAEIKLQTISAFQQAILDSANYSIISTTEDGTILTFNTGAEKMLGYSAVEVAGKTSPGIFHDLNEVIARAQELSQELGITIEPGFEVFVAKAKRGEVEEREWSYIRKDGSRLTVLLSVTALRDEQGNITGFLGISSDISEQQAALRFANKLKKLYIKNEIS